MRLARKREEQERLSVVFSGRQRCVYRKATAQGMEIGDWNLPIGGEIGVFSVQRSVVE